MIMTRDDYIELRKITSERASDIAKDIRSNLDLYAEGDINLGWLTNCLKNSQAELMTLCDDMNKAYESISKYLDSVEITNRDITIHFVNVADEPETFYIEASDCEHSSPGDNFDYVIDSISESMGEELPQAETDYLYEKIMPTIEEWSIQDEWLYC